MYSVRKKSPSHNANSETASQGEYDMDQDTRVAGQRNDEDEGEEFVIQARWRSLFNFTTRAHIPSLCLGLLLSIASGIIIPALSVFLGTIFDAFTEFGAGKISGSDLTKKVSRNAVYLVGLGSVSWLLNGSYFMFWLIFGELQAKSVRNKLFGGMLQKDMEWYDMRKAGVSAMIPRLQTQIRELQIATSQPLGFAVQHVVTMLAALGLAFYTAWSLTLVTLAVVPLSVIFLAWVSARIQPAVNAQIEQLIQASKLANSAIMAIDTVKCFNGQDTEIWQYATAVKKAAEWYIVQARANAVQIGFVRIVILSMFVQGFWFGNHLVRTGQKNAGQVLTAFWACLMATQTVEQLVPQIIVLEKGRTAATTLEAVLIKIEKGRRVTKMIGRKAPKYCEGDIQIRNVSFAYPSRPNQLALNNASFFFPAGETTFVIGRSGSGKSTLGNLLMQFYSPASGEITIDGEPINTLDTGWLRNNITLVQQQSVLFNETIFKNIAFGRRDHESVRPEEVKRCLDTAALVRTIRELPQGLETLVGTRGSAMSGGQTQRVAIARARLRNTPILMLDEATSALDHTNRSLVLEAIREWRQGKTTIIITHDVSQILDDDYAYILDRGVVVQEGYRPALEKNEDGPFTSLSQPGIAFPNKTYHDDHDIRRRAKGLSVIAASPRESLVSRDSMDIQVHRRSLIPMVYFPSADQRSSRRLSEGLISPFSPAMAHTHRMSSVRASMLPLANYSRPRESRTPIFEVPPIELKTFQPPSMYERPTPFKNKASSSRLSLRSVSLLDGDSRLPRLKAILPTKTRKVEADKTAPQVDSLKTILSTVWPRLTTKKRVILLLGFAAAFVHAAATPVFSWVFSQLLSSFYVPNGPELALKWSFAILGVAITDGVASYFMHYLLEMCGQAWVDTLRTEALKRILDQPKEWFDRDNNSLSRLTECLDRNAEEMRNLVGRFAGFVFVAIVMMVIGVVWSLITCWKLTLVGLASAPFLYGVTRGFESVSGKWEGRSNDASEAAGAIFAETFGNITTVRALTLEGYFHEKYIRATNVALKVGFRRATYSGFFFGISDAGIIFVTALIFYYGSILASTNQFSISAILIVFNMLLFCIANANAIVAFIPQINSSRDTATRLLRLANLPYHVSHEHTGTTRLATPFPITFTSLTFAYPSRPSHHVLTSLSLTLHASSSTALVGVSGSGKSTIASLILGLYPVPYNTLFVGGVDINYVHIPTLRSMIGFVPQSPLLFPTTIASNLTYGLPPSSPLTHRSNIRLAASQAGIHSFISSLPLGYDTPVQTPSNFSGGQVQRLAIARALVRRPQLLVLDEPTSGLDAEAGRGVRDLLKGLVRGGVGILVVSHDEAVVRGLEGRVVVVEGGKVRERR